MSAIRFNEAITFIREQKLTCIKILGLDGKRIAQYTDADCTTEGLCAYLSSKKSMLAPYELVQFVVTDHEGKAGNWTKAFTWQVRTNTNSNSDHVEDGNNVIKTGNISMREAGLMAELAALKLEIQYNKRFDELNAKLEGQGDMFGGFDKLIPLLPIFVNDTAKIEKIIQLAGVMNNKQPAFTGMAGTTEMSSQKTQDELNAQYKVIQDNINELVKVCGIDKVDKLIQMVKNKPELVDTALNFLNN